MLLLVAILHFRIGYAFPPISPRFLIWMALGALSQIGATFLLVHLFSFRNFAVGTAYSRTEPAQAALFGLLFLGDRITWAALSAIAICVAGVMVISVARTQITLRSLITSVGQRTALIGIVSGFGFGFSAVAYRAASLALGGPNFFMQAAVTLAFGITLQTIVMLIWIALREPEQFALIRKSLEAVADRRHGGRHGFAGLVYRHDPAKRRCGESAGAGGDAVHLRHFGFHFPREDQPL